MCLIPLKTRKFLFWTFPVIEKAKKDIIVYKVLAFSNIAPFNSSYKYQIGYNFPIHKDYLKLYETKHNRRGLVGFGWLHAYTDELSAINHTLDKKSYVNIYKMIIPKGTKYIISDDKTEICTKCLKW